jgi:hypothetical protein
MVDGAGGLDEFFGPGDRLIVLDEEGEESRAYGDGGGSVEVVLVGGPANRGAQVREFCGEPFVGRALAGAVLQRQDVGFTPGEVAGVRSTDLCRFTAGDELFLGELADRFEHGKPGPTR